MAGSGCIVGCIPGGGGGCIAGSIVPAPAHSRIHCRGSSHTRFCALELVRDRAVYEGPARQPVRDDGRLLA